MWLWAFRRAVVEELIRNTVPMEVIEIDPARQIDLEAVGALHV